MDTMDRTGRLPVDKTYKLFIKNEFVRSESGRSLAVANETTGGVTNVSRASRKDTREAVIAAKAGWAGETAYLRGQILYRLAEVMEGRRAELADARAAAGVSTDEAREEVDLAIDRVVHYAGWTDKFGMLLSSTNPVAGPHFNVTSPEPTGVVGVVPPDGGATLLTMVSTVLPVIASGNGVIVVAPERDPRTTIVWCECIATSDMPAGVVNVLTGLRSELVPQLAKHMDIQALDVWMSSTVDAALAKQAAVDGADNVKRVKVRDSQSVDWASDEAQGLSFIEPWVEQKTVWHPVGL
ncbi:MAG: aldehyde dehydrogenase family protein [Deltaproteobacteria bacterium]|nr:aldehyde dehydrogenase family protein [Deltaproteobacteria bacterium]